MFSIILFRNTGLCGKFYISILDMLSNLVHSTFTWTGRNEKGMLFKDATRVFTNIMMLKLYSFTLICLSAVMLTCIMFFCNDYIRRKKPLASIILIANSRFNSTNHKLDTMNAEQPGNWDCFITFICAIVNFIWFCS